MARPDFMVAFRSAKGSSFAERKATIRGSPDWRANRDSGNRSSFDLARERFLEGALNFVEVSGIDDWVGGLHLDSRVSDVWFCHDKKIRRS